MLKMKIKPQQSIKIDQMKFDYRKVNRYKIFDREIRSLLILFVKFSSNFYTINFIELQLLILSVETMKNRINLQLNLFQKQLKLHKERFNKSPPSKNQNYFYSSPASDAIVDFPFGRYPFQNKQMTGNIFMKTTLGCRIEEGRLQKLMDVTHPNLINVLKIIRGHPKQPASSQAAPYFSFYYEAVPYSLKRMAVISDSQTRMMAEMGKINFVEILKDVTEYLMQNGIYHEIKLDDIGVDQHFRIKIYLSPVIACGLNNRESPKHLILKNNESLVGWWKTTFPFRQTSLEAHNLSIPKVQSYENLDINHAQLIKSNKSSFIVGETSQIMGEGVEEQIENIDKMKISMPEENFKNMTYSNNISKSITPHALISSIKNQIQIKKYDSLPSPANELKCSQKTFKSQLSRLSLLQQTKMKKIHDEVQKIKKNVKKSSMDYKLRKQSDHIILQKIKAFNKTINNPQKHIFQSAKFGKTKPNPEAQPNKYNCQSIQQNINCINIYNQTPTGSNMHKNILSVPVFSYNIIPTTGEINRNMVPIRLSQRKIEPTNDRSNTDNGSNTSFEIEEHKLPVENIPFRHSLEPNDDHPHLNLRKIDKPSQSKSNKIKVTTKNVTESAGPLQFKNIINKLIKPQFAAKKSNIYEDPHEDESEHSISKHQNKIKQSQKLTVPRQQQTSLENLYEKQKARKQYDMQKIGMKKTIQGHDNIEEGKDRSRKVHDLKNQKSQTNLFKRAKLDENSLNSRIKEVLLKTKNAIQLLNKVKSSKSINHRGVSP